MSNYNKYVKQTPKDRLIERIKEANDEYERLVNSNDNSIQWVTDVREHCMYLDDLKQQFVDLVNKDNIVKMGVINHV